MKRLILFCLAAVAAPGLLQAEPVRIDNPAEPANGTQTLQLTELWRAGGFDEDVIFGVIGDVLAGPDGTVYVLDRQLAEIKVMSPDGELLDILSREGDGPGELRQPRELLWLPDDLLGVMLGFPGRIVRLGLDGTPAGDVNPAADPAEGGFCFIRNAQYAHGMLVSCAGKMNFGEDGEGSNERFMSVCDADGENQRRFLESENPLRFGEQKYIEAEDYYVENRWAIDADGIIWAAPERDAYEIHGFDDQGQHVRTITREYDARRRSAEEKDAVGADLRIVIDGEDLEIDRIVEDCDPCISRVRCDEAGRLMVLPPQGHEDQPEGVLETWDVYDGEGRFSHRLAIPRAGDQTDETTFFVGGGLLVIVKGDNEMDFGGDEVEEEEIDDDSEIMPLEVICYRID